MVFRVPKDTRINRGAGYVNAKEVEGDQSQNCDDVGTGRTGSHRRNFAEEATMVWRGESELGCCVDSVE